MDHLIAQINTIGPATLGPALFTLLWTLVKVIVVLVPLLLCVAYMTYWERKLIGWMHIRLGPNRVGPLGLLQPIADAVKLIFKEVIVPTQADAALFLAAPVLVMMPALAAWAVIPFAPGVVLSDINAGLLYVMAVTS
ncbi:MAG: NADH-quinone oxidoreductase subunit H, partial [Herbaspirillum sp.]|nr:NADH-quinone oxidoreductase subunit H [Herbaspirillum sp.]